LTQHITLEEVKVACRKAYATGTLLAQNKDKIDILVCYYRILGYKCAIGVALNKATLDDIVSKGHNGSNIDNFSLRELIHIDDNELDQIQKIQYAHDCWMRDSSYEEAFKQAVGIV
jgi:hypothetical protein